MFHGKYQYYYTVKEFFHELSFSLFVSQMGFKKSPRNCIFFIFICSISSCRCITKRLQKYAFGRYFLLQPMLQANCFLLINTYTILHTTVIWATHHLPQVDHYVISSIECSRPFYFLFLLCSDLIWNLDWWHCYMSNPNKSKNENLIITKENVFHLHLFSTQKTLPIFILYMKEI